MEKDLHSKCAVVVAPSLDDAFDMGKTLQHRGMDCAGIGAVGLNRLDVVKWLGPIDAMSRAGLKKIFHREKTNGLWADRDYYTWFLHVRYATKGQKVNVLRDAHPWVIGGEIHDRGSHVIINDCKAMMIQNGQVSSEFYKSHIDCTLESECDTEGLLHFMHQHGPNRFLEEIPGAYTLAYAEKGLDHIIAMRDPKGIRPGILFSKNGKRGIASEDVAQRKNHADFIEDMLRGHAYFIDANGSSTRIRINQQKPAYCFMEYNYLADIDSIMNRVSVRSIREKHGLTVADEVNSVLDELLKYADPEQLQEYLKDHDQSIDVVTNVPESPLYAARTAANRLGVKFEHMFYKMNKKRSFLDASAKARSTSIESNLHLIPDVVAALKNMIILGLEDSTIRATVANRVRELTEVVDPLLYIHANYTPPMCIIGKDGRPRGCNMGVDMPPIPPSDTEYIARGRTIAEISEKVGLPVFYISGKGMFKNFASLGLPKRNLCYYCIGGHHPIEDNKV